MSQKIRITMGSVILGLIAACAQTPNGDGESRTGAEGSHPTEPGHVTYSEHSDVHAAPNPSPHPAPAPGEPQDLLSRMARDLAGRLNAPVEQLQVLSAESVTWDDSSLGCPQPGRAYLPARTPGARVLFLHGGKTYQYHASERGDFVYCPNPAEPAGGLDRQ